MSMLAGLLGSSTRRTRFVAGALLGSCLVASAAVSQRQFSIMATAQAAEPKTALSPKEFRSFKLVSEKRLSHNSKLLRFSTGDKDTELGLTVASCLSAGAMIDGEDVQRPYTPITPVHTKGYFELVVKEYPNGKMGKHLCHLKVGDSVNMKGPWLKLKIEPNMKKHIGMVAGGTGITPMVQVIDHLLSDPTDKTKITLVYANVTADDILLRDHLDLLSIMHADRFKVYYVLDTPPAKWKMGTGRVNADVLKTHLPPPSDDNLVCVCGPPGMMAAVSGDKAKDRSQGELSGMLKDLGYTSSQVFKF